MFMRVLPAALIAASVALVAVGGAVLAMGSADKGGEELLDRVAAELGLEPQAVKDAVAQAQREAAKEKQDAFLARLVESEIITQEEADSAGAWLDSRPAAADRLVESGFGFPFILSATAPQIFVLPREARVLPGLDQGLLDRVAGILGIEPEALREAFGDASNSLAADRRIEALNAAVDTLVEKEVLTQTEGDEVKAWIAEMPQWLKESDLIGRIIGAGSSKSFHGVPPVIIPGEAPFRLPFRDRGNERPAPFLLPDGLEPFRFEFDEDGRGFRFELEPIPFPFKAPQTPQPEKPGTEEPPSGATAAAFRIA